MDSMKALFKKLRGRNRSSFQALSDAYGWKLYSYIRRSAPDRETADRIFSETFEAFYQMTEKHPCDDPIETLLYVCADQAGCGKETPEAPISQWEIGVETGFSLPEIRVPVKKEPVGLRIFYGICIAVLILGILAAVWIMLWMLMSMNILPRADLGYTWFNLHIADIF